MVESSAVVASPDVPSVESVESPVVVVGVDVVAVGVDVVVVVEAVVVAVVVVAVVGVVFVLVALVVVGSEVVGDAMPVVTFDAFVTFITPEADVPSAVEVSDGELGGASWGSAIVTPGRQRRTTTSTVAERW
jgi:hypothetical protein